MCNSLANGGPGSTEQLPLSSGTLELSKYLYERNDHHLTIVSQRVRLCSIFQQQLILLSSALMTIITRLMGGEALGWQS